MTAKEIIGTPTPSTFTNAELSQRIEVLENLVAILSERLSVVDGMDFLIDHSTAGTFYTFAPRRPQPLSGCAHIQP